MQLPPYLKQGDTIAIVAPARKISREALAPAIQLIEKLGFKVKSVVVIKLASIVRCPAVAEPGAVPSALSELILNDPAFISVVAVCVFMPVNSNVPEPFLVILAVPFPLITPGIESV